ncbi:MAG: hypothetical protein LM575_07830 [Caldimicrobium sp.]|nr:hypothetical protein [Caldimicrobium sp.]
MIQFRHGFLHARAVFGIVFFLFLVQPLVYAAREGKILGKTYEIIEPDAYEEILEAARKLNLEKYRKALQERIKQLAVIGDEFKLPYAKETKTRYYEPRYELPFDIKDEKGRIIYPKGFTFNPLQYMSLYGSFIFFDARNALHLNWLKKGGYTKRLDVMLIAVRGNIIEAEKVLKVPVYKATRSIIERFDVKRIPCIIRQNGKYLEITEVGERDVEKIAYR